MLKKLWKENRGEVDGIVVLIIAMAVAMIVIGVAICSYDSPADPKTLQEFKSAKIVNKEDRLVSSARSSHHEYFITFEGQDYKNIIVKTPLKTYESFIKGESYQKIVVDPKKEEIYYVEK